MGKFMKRTKKQLITIGAIVLTFVALSVLIFTNFKNHETKDDGVITIGYCADNLVIERWKRDREVFKEKAEAAGAQVFHVRENKYDMVKIPNGKVIKEWPIYGDYLKADKVINVPVAKHHSLSKVSLGMKNLMGVMGDNRGSIHADFTHKMVDIASVILPTLTIIDAYRILTGNGPQGGNPADVKMMKTLIMSPCVVAADVEAVRLFGHTVKDVKHVNEAVNRGLSKFDMNKLDVKTIKL